MQRLLQRFDFPFGFGGFGRVQPHPQAFRQIYNPCGFGSAKAGKTVMRSALPSAVNRVGEALATPALSPA